MRGAQVTGTALRERGVKELEFHGSPPVPVGRSEQDPAKFVMRTSRTGGGRSDFGQSEPAAEESRGRRWYWIRLAPCRAASTTSGLQQFRLRGECAFIPLEVAQRRRYRHAHLVIRLGQLSVNANT